MILKGLPPQEFEKYWWKILFLAVDVDWLGFQLQIFKGIPLKDRVGIVQDIDIASGHIWKHGIFKAIPI